MSYSVKLNKVLRLEFSILAPATSLLASVNLKGLT